MGTTTQVKSDGTAVRIAIDDAVEDLGTPPTLAQVYPIGCVYIAVVATSPATLFGFGTWVAFATGRVIVGIDAGQTEFDTVEETGGAKTVTLATTEIPAHTHVQNAHTHAQDSHNHTQNSHTHAVTSVGSAATGSTTNLTGASDTSSTTATAAAATATNQAATAVNQNATAVNQNAGTGGAHNNLQPYIVAYVWKRTA